MLRFLGPAVRFVTAKPGRCQTCERRRQPAVTQVSVFSVARLDFPASPRQRAEPRGLVGLHLRLQCVRSPELGWRKRQQLQTQDE